MSRYDRSPRSRSSQSRLRMDSYSSSGNGRSGQRGKSPKRNELNNVMRKARQDNSKPSIYWNKKLLEAEEKDPNRWRHSGYKELYADGSPSNRRSRSRSRSRSHVRPRSKSRSKSRSRSARSNSPRGGGLRRAPLGRDRIRSPPLPARPSPPPRQRSRDRERERERERERDRDRERDRLRERERERERAREPVRKDQGRRSRPRRPQTPEPPPPKPSASRRPEPMDIRRKGRASPLRASPRRAPSASGSSRSVSSCSDSVCSVCLPKSKGAKKATTPPPQGRRHTPPTRRTPPPRRLPAASPPTIPRRPVVSPPPSDPRGPPPSPPPAARRAAKAKRRAEREKAKLKGMSKRRRAAAGLAMVKLEGVPRHHSPPMGPGSDSDSCSTSSRSSMGAPRLTLSERFGKMAQWSENRRDLDGVRNMRITRESEGTDFKVVIDEDDDAAPYRAGALSPMPHTMGPMPVSDRRVGLGFFPEALHAAPVGLEAWDDVRVRFQYYKDRGYLRDLSLDDYMKWEEWWYKYQEWLEAERYYEQWHAMRGHLRGGRRGKRHRI